MAMRPAQPHRTSLVRPEDEALAGTPAPCDGLNRDVNEQQLTDTTGAVAWLTGGQRGPGQAFARGLVGGAAKRVDLGDGCRPPPWNERADPPSARAAAPTSTPQGL
jgi:hypothetical protein